MYKRQSRWVSKCMFIFLFLLDVLVPRAVASNVFAPQHLCSSFRVFTYTMLLSAHCIQIRFYVLNVFNSAGIKRKSFASKQPKRIFYDYKSSQGNSPDFN